MKFRIALSVICLLASSLSHGQTLVFADYTWDEKPNFAVGAVDSSISEVILKDNTLHQYYFKNDQFLEHYTMHEVIFVNSDKAIEKNNKQYIPAASTIENLTEKARVINPNGEIIELNTKDIQTYNNEEEGTSYRYFAIEGIEKGSIIELLIQQTRVPAYQGSRVFFQKSVPMYDVNFEIVSPLHLFYAFKSYNGLADVKNDTMYKEMHHYFLHADTVPALKEDAQGAYTSNRQFLIHKLHRNSASNRNDFTSYASVAQNLHSALYESTSKKVKKKLAEIIKKANLAMSRNEEDKIRTLETYVKENFKLVDATAPVLKDLEFITENSIYSKWGASFLTANLLKELGIEHELVVTTDRFDLRFDKDFEAHNFLQDALIYVPSIDKYIAPGSPFLRTGVIPFENAGNYGLFISEVKVGDFVSAVGQVKKLPETVYSDNQHNLYIDVDLSEDPFLPKLHIRTELSGYYAQYIQPIYQYLNQEQQEELLKSQMEYIDPEGKFENIHSSNDRSYNFGRTPMIVEADLNTENFSESVGNDVLFRIGMLIGQQMEMYREEVEARTHDVETQYARNYERVLKLTIPEGYELSGLESLNMDHVYDQDGSQLGFTSNYKVEGNLLTVTVNEYYKNQTYPKSLFAAYRTVINAASDFNKTTVLLKKKA